jgi:hypothetical protein
MLYNFFVPGQTVSGPLQAPAKNRLRYDFFKIKPSEIASLKVVSNENKRGREAIADVGNQSWTVMSV